ncbi:recombination protein U [Salsuginibacillus halophilus]|uniref:Holliday junction resolvase RecU n=1 Tax=Salsuginibacillus halophilus TaxID=517424 RepID=A0A2P8HWC9_9BACI|nr:Holliday junction resolvase RecU [Salsuginibacillus halophilus]PSL50542.1 recombination protein U [Salsuginibacillus halophilus]
MAFRYPNGRRYNQSSQQGRKKENYNNRGMRFEEDINSSINYYRETGRALIHKKPTPVQIVSVDYPKRSAAKITEAYFRQPSTTDYQGIYRGMPVDFEAKETRSHTSFPLKNLHLHQVKHLEEVKAHGGLAFLLLRFGGEQAMYVIDAAHVIPWYYDQSERKSLTKRYVASHSCIVPEKLQPRYPFLDAVDELYFTNDS